MSKPISIGQSHIAMSILSTNADWDTLDSETLQRVIDNPREAGKHFTAFLRNGGRVIIGEPKVIALQPSTFFNPAKFIGEGWTIEEEDEHSRARTQIDLTAVRFESMLKQGEVSVKGEDKLRRLKDAGLIRLDARWFQFLWENQHLIPSIWKEQPNGQTTFIYFDGTVLRYSGGNRGVLCLSWGGSRWYWYYHWLDDRYWHVDDVSAVLASD